MKTRTKSNPPKRIWLQWNGESDSTWCKDRIMDVDIEYARVDRADRSEPTEAEIEKVARRMMRDYFLPEKPSWASQSFCHNFWLRLALWHLRQLRRKR